MFSRKNGKPEVLTSKIKLCGRIDPRSIIYSLIFQCILVFFSGLETGLCETAFSKGTSLGVDETLGKERYSDSSLTLSTVASEKSRFELEGHTTKLNGALSTRSLDVRLLLKSRPEEKWKFHVGASQTDQDYKTGVAGLSYQWIFEKIYNLERKTTFKLGLDFSTFTDNTNAEKFTQDTCTLEFVRAFSKDFEVSLNYSKNWLPRDSQAVLSYYATYTQLGPGISVATTGLTEYTWNAIFSWMLSEVHSFDLSVGQIKTTESDKPSPASSLTWMISPNDVWEFRVIVSKVASELIPDEGTVGLGATYTF